VFNPDAAQRRLWASCPSADPARQRRCTPVRRDGARASAPVVGAPLRRSNGDPVWAEYSA